MGQRLVMSIKKDGESLAAVYFHWSGYTISALQEAKEFVESLECNPVDVRLHTIRFYEKRGGGIVGGEDSPEFSRIQEMYPNDSFKKENRSRNEGLVAITDKGIRELEDWAEEVMDIELDTRQVRNFVLYEDFEDDFEKKEREVKDDPFTIPFDNLDNVIQELQEAQEQDADVIKYDGVSMTMIY